jgi:uncharacterized protein (DUF2342 family)
MLSSVTFTRRRPLASGATGFCARLFSLDVAAVRHTGGTEGRDALWGHPDLLPSAEDLCDPLGFVERSNADFDFDA